MSDEKFDLDAFLEHHGVKGMKWGRRRSRNELARAKQFGPKKSSDAKKADKLRGRKSHELSNKQLKEINERLNLEQNYRRMNPTAVERGRNQATAVLATVGIGVTAYNMATSNAGKAAIAAGKKLIKGK